jgi:formate--tetrahydrofolate ligase
VRRFGIPCVVAINVFADDTEDELAHALADARDAGADAAHLSSHVADGGVGAEELAAAVFELSRRPSTFESLYPDEMPLRDKIERIATEIYGADGVEIAPAADEELRRLERDGYGSLPICVAKTPLSISHDPKRPGVPSGYRLPIRRVRLFAGAGFVTVYAGAIQTMPGLPRVPAAARIDLTEDGSITGL